MSFFIDRPINLWYTLEHFKANYNLFFTNISGVAIFWRSNPSMAMAV